jgi:predicted DNA binding CopG/RHH family protein
VEWCKMNRKKTHIHTDDAMITALESDGYEAVEDEALEIQRYTKIFRESGNKVKRVNIRMTEQDVEKAQAIALREGIPYATLLTNILRRYFTGRLKDSHT